jgi:hypothetical protein
MNLPNRDIDLIANNILNCVLDALFGWAIDDDLPDEVVRAALHTVIVALKESLERVEDA